MRIALPAVAAACLGIVYMHTSGNATSAVYDGVSALTFVAIVVGIKRRGAAPRHVWTLFAAGQFLFVAADVSFELFDFFPSPGDLLYLSGYVFFFAGIVLLVPRQVRLTALLEAGVFTSGAAVFLTLYVVGPTARGAGGDAVSRLAAAAYPIMDTFVLAGALALMLGTSLRSRSSQLLAASLFALLASDVVYALLTIHDAYPDSGPSLVDLGWLASYTLFAAAALDRSVAQAPVPLTDLDPRPLRPRVALAGLALAAGPLAGVAEAALGRTTRMLEIALLSLVTAAFSFARLLRLLVEQAQSERHFRALIERATDVIAVISPGGRIDYASPAASGVFGRPVTELVGSHATDLVPPDGVDDASEAFARAAAGEIARWEQRVLHVDGSTRYLEATARRLDSGPRAGAVLVNAHDVSGRRQLEEELRRRASSDSLTGFANREHFTHLLELELERRDGPLTLLFIDLDDFKTINDSLGHEAGDRLLVAVAERLRQALRLDDVVCRLGGDEFAVLVAAGAEDGATATAERILALFARPIAFEHREVVVSASVGIATGRDPLRLLREADSAMYEAKRAGGAQHALFLPSMQEAALERLELRGELLRALEADEFVLHYQPVVACAGSAPAATVGLEALVRWQHPQRGLVPPAAFIPFAEETGLIVQLGELVLRRACRDLAGWRRRHPAARGLRVGVNVAALQLERGGFLATVESALAEAGLDADALTIEVTETTLLRPTPAVLAELSALRERGLLVAIDDFGGGSSPLAYLRSLPVDVLKIDRSFVAECDGDARDAALVRGVVRLAHELGLRTVGEGVERPAQAALLHDAGCDLSQGYLTGRPVPADAVEELLARAVSHGVAA